MAISGISINLCVSRNDTYETQITWTLSYT